MKIIVFYVFIFVYDHGETEGVRQISNEWIELKEGALASYRVFLYWSRCGSVEFNTLVVVHVSSRLMLTCDW